LVVEEIIIIIVIIFDDSDSPHLALPAFLVGLGEHKTVSNVPGLPALSHEV
jgi:hypothetical protein